MWRTLLIFHFKSREILCTGLIIWSSYKRQFLSRSLFDSLRSVSGLKFILFQNECSLSVQWWAWLKRAGIDESTYRRGLWETHSVRWGLPAWWWQRSWKFTWTWPLPLFTGLSSGSLLPAYRCRHQQLVSYPWKSTKNTHIQALKNRSILNRRGLSGSSGQHSINHITTNFFKFVPMLDLIGFVLFNVSVWTIHKQILAKKLLL